MDRIFDICVHFLENLASLTGLTYKQINVWIFCIIWPILTLILIVANIVLYARIRVYKKRITGTIN